MKMFKRRVIEVILTDDSITKVKAIIFKHPLNEDIELAIHKDPDPKYDECVVTDVRTGRSIGPVFSSIRQAHTEIIKYLNKKGTFTYLTATHKLPSVEAFKLQKLYGTIKEV